jgi:amicyanin
VRAARGAALSAVLALLALPLLSAGQASAATYRVTMKGYAFSPASLTVPAGSTVTWTNQDTAPHDVKTTSGPASIHSPMLDKGQSWSFTFTGAGSYGYYCTVHPDMTAGITVRAAAAPTHHHTADSGSAASGSSGSSHSMPEHHTTAPSRPPTMSRMPSPTGPPASPTPGAAAPQPSQPPGSPQPAQLPQPVTPTASTSRPLDPLLLLAGIVAGVAVMCLLLVGSRAAAARNAEDT